MNQNGLLNALYNENIVNYCIAVALGNTRFCICVLRRDYNLRNQTKTFTGDHPYDLLTRHTTDLEAKFLQC